MLHTGTAEEARPFAIEQVLWRGESTSVVSPDAECSIEVAKGDITQALVDSCCCQCKSMPAGSEPPAQYLRMARDYVAKMQQVEAEAVFDEHKQIACVHWCVEMTCQLLDEHAGLDAGCVVSWPTVVGYWDAEGVQGGLKGSAV